MRPSSRLIASWVLAGIYASGVFTLSSLSNPPVPKLDVPHIDKLYHFIEYTGLAFLLIRALCITFRTHPEPQLILWGVALTVLYGFSDELHQAFTPGRVMSGYDIVADAVGASLVGLAWPRVRRRWSTIVNSAGEE